MFSLCQVDTVVMAVARAVHKKTLFDLPQRLALAQAALSDCPNVRVLPFDGLIVDFVRAQGASVNPQLPMMAVVTPW